LRRRRLGLERRPQDCAAAELASQNLFASMIIAAALLFII